MKKIEDWKIGLYLVLVLFGVILLWIMSAISLMTFEWRGMQQDFEEIKYQVYTPAIGIIKGVE